MVIICKCIHSLLSSTKQRKKIDQRIIMGCEKMNHLKKGDNVVMHTCIEAEEHNGKIWIVRYDEYKNHPSHDYTVTMLEGFSGSFATKYLQKVNINPLDQIMSCQEAAELWNLNPDYIRELCNKGKVKAKNIGKTWIIDRNQPNPKKILRSG